MKKYVLEEDTVREATEEDDDNNERTLKDIMATPGLAFYVGMTKRTLPEEDLRWITPRGLPKAMRAKIANGKPRKHPNLYFFPYTQHRFYLAAALMYSTVLK